MPKGTPEYTGADLVCLSEFELGLMTYTPVPALV